MTSCLTQALQKKEQSIMDNSETLSLVTQGTGQRSTKQKQHSTPQKIKKVSNMDRTKPGVNPDAREG